VGQVCPHRYPFALIYQFSLTRKKNLFFLQIQKTIFKGIRKAKEKYIHSSLTKQKEKKAK